MLNKEIKSPDKNISDSNKKIDIKSPNLFQSNCLKPFKKNDLCISERKSNYENNNTNFDLNFLFQKRPNKFKLQKHSSMKKLSSNKRYILNLIRQNIQKRNNILPKIKLNFIVTNSEKRFETEETPHKKLVMNNFLKNIRSHRLPKIIKNFQKTEENINTISIENDIKIVNNGNKKNKNVNSSSANTERQNKNLKRIIEIENKNFEEFFQNIEKNVETKKNYIDVNNMMERIEDIKKISQQQNNNKENNNNENDNNKKSCNFFISETINYEKNDLDLLKEELGIEVKNDENNEGEKNEKNSEELSLNEIEKLKNNDKKFIFDVNKKLINKEKIIGLCNLNSVPNTIFDGNYKNIKKMEKISRQIKKNKLEPLKLGKSSSVESLVK